MPEVDLTGPEWQNKFISDVLGGIVLDAPEDSLRDNQFLRLDNLRYSKRRLVKDTGYADYGVKPSGTPGVFQKVFRHVTAAGAVSIFAVTRNTFLQLNGANWEGVKVPSGGDTTLSANASGTDTALTVTAITDFDDGDRIAIELDDGSFHVTTINGAPAGSTINVDDALPGSGVVATSGNSVYEVISLSGSADKHVFGLTIPWNDALVFTNGVDTPKYYDPSTTFVQVIPNLPSTGNTICESVALFDNSLVLVRTTEGGSQKNQRLRWCDRADFTEWVSGDAGSIDLLDSNDFIQNALGLGPFLIIYRQKTIYRGEAVNTSDKRFTWDRMITNEGVMSPASIADLGTSHLLVGNRNLHLYNGGFTTKKIGDRVKSLLFGSDAAADRDNLHRTFIVYIEARDELLVFYQSLGAFAAPDMCLRYDVVNNAFLKRALKDEVIGFGEVTSTNSFAWDDLVGSWLEQTWQWNSGSISGTIETIALCAADGGIHEYDFLTPNDDGTAISWVIETPDFVHHNGFLRTDYVELACSGGDFLLEVSLDRGGSYQSVQTVNPGAEPARIRAFGQYSSDSIRYRMSGNVPITFRWYNIRLVIETEN